MTSSEERPPDAPSPKKVPGGPKLQQPKTYQQGHPGSTEECGQGDCKGLSTPDNPVVPNLKEMVKAPHVKRPSSCSIDWEEYKFLEILGKLEFECAEPFLEKKLERLILGYTDQIHLIIYEAKNN